LKILTLALILVLGVIAFSSTLTLKSYAIVSGKYVNLYDLAATFNGVSIQKLKDFVVAFSPQPGSSYVVDSKTVKIRAEREIKWLKVSTISDKIKITSKAFVIDFTRIQNALTDKMKTHVFLTNFPNVKTSFATCSVNVKNVSKVGGKDFALVELKRNKTSAYVNVSFETDLVGTVDNVKDVAKAISSKLGKNISLSLKSDVPNVDFDFIEIGKPFNLSTKVMAVPVNFVSSSNVKMSTVLEYVPHEYENVIVASRDIRYGQKLTRSSLKTKRLDVYATSTLYETSVSACVGKMTTWSFRKGQVVSLIGLKSPPDVVAGQVLMAYITYPSMIVTTFVRVMQNGNIGQVIAVRNVENGYMLYGTLEKGTKIRVYSGGD